mgnify:CR=1 FL=1
MGLLSKHQSSSGLASIIAVLYPLAFGLLYAWCRLDPVVDFKNWSSSFTRDTCFVTLLCAAALMCVTVISHYVLYTPSDEEEQYEKNTSDIIAGSSFYVWLVLGIFMLYKIYVNKDFFEKLFLRKGGSDKTADYMDLDSTDPWKEQIKSGAVL